ncbi:hypothetical protein SK128_024709 [Halocaridina rubra]|uniref:Uncharacterized protein n=1 Tax=Halocaridina rubra TaxID=373956 RepID=A0AAN8X5R7_HALRR
MFYQRSSVTGRLTSVNGVQTPSTLSAAVEGPAVTYPVGTTFPKELPAGKGVPGLLAQKMKLFQASNDIPIHLKGGPVDKVLFGTTIALCAVGLAGCLQYFYSMSFPKKNTE